MLLAQISQYHSQELHILRRVIEQAQRDANGLIALQRKQPLTQLQQQSLNRLRQVVLKAHTAVVKMIARHQQLQQ
jgi:hypothetical protein